IRIKKINPILKRGESIELDFEGVTSATQSFIHALISQLIRYYGTEVLDKIQFKNCNNTLKKIIEIVTDYMQFRE
ncbi:STAS-like domain-containing protein, partial [Mangrovimonas sp. AS39]|uniref:STAS-like domain-containing protein n=1 Tax=Mangrovimonas futianensis TaxID=2895523 RepID=UPI001E64F121